MPQRENKATLKDQGLEDAFRQGFGEGVAMAGALVMYTLEVIFEGTTLRNVQFSDLDQCLAEAREHLLHGHRAAVIINAVVAPTQSAQVSKAVDEDIIDVEAEEPSED